MRATELIPGEDYILDILAGLAATFEGRQSAASLQAFDDKGTPIALGGYAGWLRFRTVGQNPRIVFVPDGSRVVESVHAKSQRERIEAEAKAKAEAAWKDATAFVESVGLTISTHGGAKGSVRLSRPYSAADADDLEIDRFTVGHLRRLITQPSVTS